VFDLGLRFVHQEDEGFGSLSIAENLAGVRGFPHDGLGRIRWRVLHRRAQDLLDRYEIRADARQRLDTLRPATIRMVAIARALQDRDEADDGILVLDEPAAALPPAEVGLLHEALRRYAAAGQAILYVTHRLDELEDFADRATVLRDGAVAGSLGGSELRHDRLVKLIAGETLAPHPRAPRLEAQSDIRLEVRRCTGGPLSDVSLTVRAGEVLGVAGLDGSGRSSLLQMIFGVLARTSGEVHFDGMPLRAGAVPAHPGLAYLPESRSHAAFANLSLAVNLSAASHDRYGRRLGWRHRLERVEARAAIRRFGIAAKGEDQEFLTLSGGNQQKAILARWLRRGPAVLLLDEPTQGVDVGARADVHELIRASTRRGGTAIVVSSDFEELATLSDRVIVLRQGRIAGELDSANIDPRHLERAVHGRAPSR
jgi:ribose transport system ATP-binding protein